MQNPWSVQQPDDDAASGPGVERRPGALFLPTREAQEVARAGQFDMAVVYAEPSLEAAERWARRVDRLAALLLALWEQERQQAPPGEV